MALTTTEKMTKQILDILRDKMGIGNKEFPDNTIFSPSSDKMRIGIMDKSKQLFPNNDSMGKKFAQTLITEREAREAAMHNSQYNYQEGIAVQASQATTNQVGVMPVINPSDYNLEALMAEQARLSLCRDVAQAKLNQATQAMNDADFACERHINLIKSVVNATIDNIKKVLK